MVVDVIGRPLNVGDCVVFVHNTGLGIINRFGSRKVLCTSFSFQEIQGKYQIEDDEFSPTSLLYYPMALMLPNHPLTKELLRYRSEVFAKLNAYPNIQSTNQE